MTRQILKILQGLGGLVMLIVSILFALRGEYPRATYDLLLAGGLMYWSEQK